MTNKYYEMALCLLAFYALSWYSEIFVPQVSGESGGRERRGKIMFRPRGEKTNKGKWG